MCLDVVSKTLFFQSDTNLPCSACIRYHKTVNKGVGADEIQGQLPTCTYDDPREVFEGHKSKIAKLEAKIG